MTATDGRLVVGSQEWAPTEVELFMFSAASWLTHRIHFDREYARSEGHRDLVVHGPFQAAKLTELLASMARRHHGELVESSYRHRSPAFVGDRLRVEVWLPEATPEAGASRIELLTGISTDGGREVTTGRAVVAFEHPDDLSRLVASGSPP